MCSAKRRAGRERPAALQIAAPYVSLAHEIANPRFHARFRHTRNNAKRVWSVVSRSLNVNKCSPKIEMEILTWNEMEILTVFY